MPRKVRGVVELRFWWEVRLGWGKGLRVAGGGVRVSAVAEGMVRRRMRVVMSIISRVAVTTSVSQEVLCLDGGWST